MRKIDEVLCYEEEIDGHILGIGMYYKGCIIIVINYDASNKEDIRNKIENRIHSGDKKYILKKGS